MYGNGYQINRVAISGSNGPRASLFAPVAREVFGLGGVMGFNPQLAAIALGQTAETYYTDAKKEIAKFDTLVDRVARLANKAIRDQMIEDYGLTDPSNKDKALYMRGALASDVAQADRFRLPSGEIPYNQGFPERGPSRGRVDKLHDWNRGLGREVQYAETTYGVLPEPVVIERVVTVPGEGTSPWPYLVVGAGVVAALAVAGVI